MARDQTINRPGSNGGQGPDRGLVDERRSAAATLRRFARVVDTHKSGAPAVLAVVTATGYGDVRDDGVAVLPVGALAP